MFWTAIFWLQVSASRYRYCWGLFCLLTWETYIEGVSACVRICWWWGMRRSGSWASHNCTNTWNVPCFLSNSQKYIYYYFETFFSQISLYNKTEKLICHCLWLQGYSPEVPLVVGDSVSRAVWCWRFQNHDFHLLRSVATGTGHQALPDSSNGHIDAGENNLAGGREKTRKTMKMCF